MVQAMKCMKHIPVDDFHYTLYAMDDLVTLLIDQERLEKAEELCTGILEVWTTILGEKHPETLRVMCTLAQIHAKQGHSKRGEDR